MQVLTVRSNTDGCAGLRRALVGQAKLIASARAATTGVQRTRLTAAESHWVEFHSWIEANSYRPARAEALLDRAYAPAVEAEDQPLAAYMLMRKSQQALDNGDAVRAVRLAQQARQGRQLPPRVLALCLVREAEGHALADDATASRQSIDQALCLASTPQETADELGGHCTIDYVRASEARCRQLLGESAAAISSARALRAVGRLLPRLRRDRDLPAVPEFTDAYRAAVDAVTMNT